MNRTRTSCFLIITFLLGCNSASEVGNPDIYPYYKEYISKPHFRALAATARSSQFSGWAGGDGSGHSSVEAAIEEAMQACETARKRHGAHFKCRLNYVGNINVANMSEEQLDEAIKLYRSNVLATNGDLLKPK